MAERESGDDRELTVGEIFSNESNAYGFLPRDFGVNFVHINLSNFVHNNHSVFVFAAKSGDGTPQYGGTGRFGRRTGDGGDGRMREIRTRPTCHHLPGKSPLFFHTMISVID